jgi:hypothetical protein
MIRGTKRAKGILLYLGSGYSYTKTSKRIGSGRIGNLSKMGSFNLICCQASEGNQLTLSLIAETYMKHRKSAVS